MHWTRAAKTALKLLLAPAVIPLMPRRVDLALEHWQLDRHPEEGLRLRGAGLKPILEEFGSPLFVVDAARLDENAAAFTRPVPGSQVSVKCFYSYKTNPVTGVLARLHANGVGAEVISDYEMWLARRLGVNGPDIVLNGPGRSPAAFRSAIETDALICLNHREEVPLVAGIARQLGKRALVGLRVVPGRGWGGQFGEPIADGAALATYREMVSHPELSTVAVHAHLGREIATGEEVTRLGGDLMDFTAVLKRELGLELDIVDVGGSLATPTVSPHDQRVLFWNRTVGADLLPRDPASVLSIEAYLRAVVSTVERHCARDGLRLPRVFVEPGRALTGNAQLLLCTVSNLKRSGADGVVHAILDAGVNIAEPLRTEYHQLLRVDSEQGPEQRYRLVGPICTPMDTLIFSWRAPALRRGSMLAIMDAGAYFIPFATSFSFPQPAIVQLEDGRVSLLRRRETYADLVLRDQTALADAPSGAARTG